MAMMCDTSLRKCSVVCSVSVFDTNKISHEGRFPGFVEDAFRPDDRRSIQKDAMGMFNPGGREAAFVQGVLNEGRRSKRTKYTVKTIEEDYFVGGHHLFQGQVINLSVLKTRFFFLPVFIQSRRACVLGAKKEEPDLLAIPLCTSPTHEFHAKFGSVRKYRIYVDFLKPNTSIIENGTIYTFKKKTGPLSILIDFSDRAAIKDIIFVTFNDGDDDDNGGNNTILIYIVDAVEPADEGQSREIYLKPYVRPPVVPTMNAREREDIISQFYLPDTIDTVGYIDTCQDDVVDTYNQTGTIPTTDQIEASIRHLFDMAVSILDDRMYMSLPAKFSLMGSAAPVQPKQFDIWKSVINAMVLLDGNVTVILNHDFFLLSGDRPWCSGDDIELQLGEPISSDPEYVEFNARNPLQKRVCRLEARYVRPGTTAPPHWDRIVWSAWVGKYIIELAHEHYYSAQILLHTCI